jgi:carbonic anhydrase
VHQHHIDFLPFSDLDQSVRDDVELIKSTPGLERTKTVTGWVYEVETGRIREVR